MCVYLIVAHYRKGHHLIPWPVVGRHRLHSPMSRTFVQKSNEKVQGKSYMRGSRAVVHNYLVSLFSPCVYNWAREKKEKKKKVNTTTHSMLLLPVRLLLPSCQHSTVLELCLSFSCVCVCVWRAFRLLPSHRRWLSFSRFPSTFKVNPFE